MLSTAKWTFIAASLVASATAYAQAKDPAPQETPAPPAAAPATPPAAAPAPPAATPAAPATPPQASAPAGTKAVVVDLSTMDALIGKNVRSATNEDLGRLIDLVVETNGQVRAAIIDFGGVLGVGSRKIAVDWRALDFSGSAKGGPIKLALTRNQVRLSPEYRTGEPIVILEDSGPEAPPVPAAKAAAAPVPAPATAK
jgi:hypothetical protein